MSTVACLGQGTIDGIESGNDGGILVSHNEGGLFHVAPDGGATTLLDTKALRMNLADFEYVTGQNMVVFPTFTDSRVAAFRLGKQGTPAPRGCRTHPGRTESAVHLCSRKSASPATARNDGDGSAVSPLRRGESAIAPRPCGE